MTEVHDVVVVGSGGAGLMAALRASDLGLSVLVIEKAHKFGGTTATSGGVMWIPNHGLSGDDSREEALRYLKGIADGPIRHDRLEAFVDTGPEMVAYMRQSGMQPVSMSWPDYFQEAPGARSDRSLVFPLYDGRRLGDHFPLMREQFTRFKLLNRYSMDFSEAFSISSRSPGWLRTFSKIVGRYWGDVNTRKLTARDRWLSLGGAMLGPIVERLLQRGVELRLGTSVQKLLTTDGRITGVETERFGTRGTIQARHGVIICAGGFEWNQELRNRFFAVPGETRWSSTPPDGNRGELLEAGIMLGAATEFTETGWWAPTMIMPIRNASNFEEIHQAVFDVGRPHSVCINRHGVRFVNESCSHDRFGNAMVEDQKRTGANAQVWLVFDAVFRRKFTAGGFLPSAIMPDSGIPVDWWDHYIFKARTIEQLARKIDVDPDALGRTIASMNAYARTGIDPEFHRGESAYDRNFGDPAVMPNPCLGPIEKPPFYAIPINLGDAGTKGGLKADARARVLDIEGNPIPGLYAAGNAAGSPFGNCYPGAGGTIGPAMVFGYIAANDIAEQANRTTLGGYTHNQPPTP